MLKYRNLLTLIIIATMLFSGCSSTQEDTALPNTVAEDSAVEDDNAYGAIGAELDDSYTIEEMLVYAIQDEFLARAEYEKLIDEFEVDRPFTNIIRAEETHIELLKPLFESYDINLPLDTSKDHLLIPNDLKEVYEIGVQAELDNIAMYESFLLEDLPEDIRTVFESLKTASESHLLAFQKNLNRY